MDLRLLRDELTTDPAGLGYAAMGDVAAAGELNAAKRTVYVPVSTETLMGAAYDILGEGQTISLYPRLRIAMRMDATPPEIVGVIEALLDLRQVPFVTILDAAGEIAAPTGAMFGALAAAGLIGEDEIAAICALAVRTISRAEEIGLPTITPGDVERARGGAW